MLSLLAIKKQIPIFGTLVNHGWLKIAFNDNQLNIGESYISIGSLYLCSLVFLMLGLQETDNFWSSSEELWTQKRHGKVNNFQLILNFQIYNL